MFAVIKTGGKQYRVSPDAVLKIEKISGEAGQQVVFEEVLLIGDEKQSLIVGSPTISNASVTAEIINQARDPKVLIFKRKRRKNYQRKTGHRQDVTHVKITAINKK